MLTTPGAQDLVTAVHSFLRSEYRAVPPCFTANDEPAGDFGIAHFYGLTSNYCAITTYDVGTPRWYVIAHEFGHGVEAVVNKLRGNTNPFTNGLYDSFWAAIGYPGTPWDSHVRALNAEAVRVDSGYIYWPREIFADIFGVINTLYAFPITHQYAYLDQPKMRAWFKTLEGLDVLTEAEMDRIAEKAAGLILPRIEAKLDAGFNVTLSTFLDRQSAGDKKVLTERID